MDGRDWKKFLMPYEQAVEELKVKFKTMRAELKIWEEYSPVEFVTGRVKRISSILEKSKRLNVPMEKLETGIEDIAGIRIMCQFVEDIERLAELIRKREDMKLIYEKDYILNKKPSGYRSYHMIVEYPVQTALGMKRVLAEIQLRTLAMNFWATIEHSLNYKYRESLPEKVLNRLSKAAEAAFLLDQEMSNIREEIMEAQKLFEDKSNIVNRVLNGIQELYFYHRVREAAQFQLRFNELWDTDDVWHLKRLSSEIEDAIIRAKKGSTP
ncbi:MULTISPECIES: GTP pyrophosphokinase [Paenibacillus]|uniref:GTP diphosphokinase n=1 Tax=Paenibacillus naphthalenovorans TaxID=162209 RepID=A0A0U2ILL5_9BACL|nr:MULTISPECIES: GTP pyrophosphokinase family protein [Paenibacillus]ALS21035.1 GTP pyrophosphokinase [Paenibacillus naphthalenovorans]NTZ18739.1 GTP pyrophosphokinase family protein [Paenibacillus sp. JMULE4]GCL71070.1 GTP pyrophosphokinase [Paenibacillus naphthalenovorans]SDI62203.1 putative GTP pyrophosphokinase [Paenibacillus naphthalenovorans]